MNNLTVCCGAQSVVWLCFTQVQLLLSLHLTAFLLQLHLLLLLPTSWLCSYSPRRPDHGKCTHPDCSPPQTEWPMSKQAQHLVLGFPESLQIFQSAAGTSSSNAMGLFRPVSRRFNVWLNWQNQHCIWLVSLFEMIWDQSDKILLLFPVELKRDRKEKENEKLQGKRKYYIRAFNTSRVTKKCTSWGGFPSVLLHFNCTEEYNLEWQKQTIKTKFAWTGRAAREQFCAES